MTEFLSFLIAGIVYGAIYAVSASGLVVTYNTTGIFNFAHGAMGMILAYLFWQLWQGWGLPEVLSLVIVLFVAAPLMGVVVERVVMRPLYGAATSIVLAVTLGLLLVLVALAGTIWSPTANTYNTPELVNGNPISINGITLSWEQLITVAVAIAVAVFLRVFFRRTRTGVAMRAVVDDPSLASLSGAPSGRISGYAWMIGVMFAGIGGILLAPSVQGMNIQTLTQLVIYGYAAAVVGRLRSLPMTFLGAMILGIANSMAIGYSPQSIVNYVTAALPMALLFLALLLIPEVRLAIGRVVRVRPPRVASARTTLAGAAAVVVVVVVLGTMLTGNNLYTMGNALVLSLLALSLVPLSGYAGQVSLCQFTFLGIGAVTMHAVDGGARSWDSWPPSGCAPGSVRCWRYRCCAFGVCTWPWRRWPSPCSWTACSSSRAPSWASGARWRSVGPTSSACTSPPTVPSTSSSLWSWRCVSSVWAPFAGGGSAGVSSA